MASNQGSAKTIAQLLGRLTTLCDSGFALAAHIRYTRPTLLYQTYSQDWTDHYSEKGYMMSDPTVHWGLSNLGAMAWDSMTDIDPEGVIAAARSYGIANGWTYSVGPATSRSIASMARKTPFSPDQRTEVTSIIDDIHAQTEGFDTFSPDVQDKLRRLI